MPFQNQLRIHPDTHSFAVEIYKINGKTGEGAWVAQHWYPTVAAAAQGVLQDKFKRFDSALFDPYHLEDLKAACDKSVHEVFELLKELSDNNDGLH